MEHEEGKREETRMVVGGQAELCLGHLPREPSPVCLVDTPSPCAPMCSSSHYRCCCVLDVMLVRPLLPSSCLQFGWMYAGKAGDWALLFAPQTSRSLLLPSPFHFQDTNSFSNLYRFCAVQWWLILAQRCKRVCKMSRRTSAKSQATRHSSGLPN